METRKRRKMLVAAVAKPKPVARTENEITFQKEDVAAKTEIMADKVFSISLVTDCIFKHLATSDLLSRCSLVCKIWDSAVKEYLHRCRTCLFQCNLVDFVGLRSQLETVKNRLQNNISLPFRGINVVITPRVSRLLNAKSRQASRLKSIVEDFISLIDMTYTVITLADHEFFWGDRVEGQLKFEFFEDLDQMLSNVLFPLLSTAEIRHLSFKEFGKKLFNWETWFENVEDGGFPALETIPYTPYEIDYVENYDALLRTCPKLKEMPTDATFHSIMTFDKYNKLPLLKTLINCSADELDFDNEQFKALAKAKDILELVQLGVCCNWTPEQFRWIGQILLLNSNSLREVQVSYDCSWLSSDEASTTSSYENIFKINFPPMPFVKKVRVVYAGEPLRPQDNDQNLRRHPHLKKLFPKARIVTEHQLGNKDCDVTLIIIIDPTLT